MMQTFQRSPLKLTNMPLEEIRSLQKHIEAIDRSNFNFLAKPTGLNG